MNAVLNKRNLFPFFLLLSACSNEPKPIDDTEKIISQEMIANILELSSCLSVRATPGEKYGIVQAVTINPDVRDRESLNKYIKQSQEDFDFLLKVAEEKCPNSLNSAISSIRTADSKDARQQVGNVLQDIIVNSISSEIITLEERKQIFEKQYQPF